MNILAEIKWIVLTKNIIKDTHISFPLKCKNPNKEIAETIIEIKDAVSGSCKTKHSLCSRLKCRTNVFLIQHSET